MEKKKISWYSNIYMYDIVSIKCEILLIEILLIFEFVYLSFD